MSSGLERVERKLAAIFCADVADYSRLMGDDEVQTLRTLTAHRAIMDGLIAQHAGRIANTAGDSVLAEFPSVVDAVECAVVVQEKLGAANAGVPEDEALRFRIGVHVGDVMVRGGDLLGDGVNVAAESSRLLSRAGYGCPAGPTSKSRASSAWGSRTGASSRSRTSLARFGSMRWPVLRRAGPSRKRCPFQTSRPLRSCRSRI